MDSVPDKQIVGEFIDAAVRDPAKAKQLLQEFPGLKQARWLHDETPLHFLAVEGYTEGVRLLCQLGFDPNVPNEFGDTALIDVVTLDDQKIAAILLEYGADPNAKSPTRDCMLNCAILRGNATMVDLLLSAGAHVYYTTEAELSVFDALLTAETTERQSIEAVLAKHGIRRPESE